MYLLGFVWLTSGLGFCISESLGALSTLPTATMGPLGVVQLVPSPQSLQIHPSARVLQRQVSSRSYVVRLTSRALLKARQVSLPPTLTVSLQQSLEQMSAGRGSGWLGKVAPIAANGDAVLQAPQRPAQDAIAPQDAKRPRSSVTLPRPKPPRRPHSTARSGLDGEPTEVCLPMQGATDTLATQVRVPTLHPITYHGYVIAEVPDATQARKFSQQLNTALDLAQVDGTAIQPGNDEKGLGVYLGDRLLLPVPQLVTENLNCNLELLTIRWANNLRQATGHLPLPLVTAQQRLHQLQETNHKLQGTASWYGPYFHGRLTATGEIFDQHDFTAAHPTLPFNTFLKVKNLNNQRTIIVRINDRGPYVNNRMLDLSREAARALDSQTAGVVPIEATIMQTSPGLQATQSRENAPL